MAQFTASEIAHRLGRKVKENREGYMAICPNHADKNPSLSVRETVDGKIKLKCFAPSCADVRAVYAAVERRLGLEQGDLGGPDDNYRPTKRVANVKRNKPEHQAILPVPADAPKIDRKANSSKFGKPTKIWTYRNHEGAIMGHVARYEVPAEDDKPADKLIWPWIYGIRDGKRQWIVAAMPEPRVPYNLDKIVANPDAPILWHEGEKAADAGEALFAEWISTTTQGGGSAPHMTDYSHLAGRLVIIAHDNDSHGIHYAAAVAGELLKVGATVRILRFPTTFCVENGELVRKPYVMKEGDDMADHQKNGWTTELIREAVRKSRLPLTWSLEEWPIEEVSDGG